VEKSLLAGVCEPQLVAGAELPASRHAFIGQQVREVPGNMGDAGAPRAGRAGVATNPCH
jgi:hypothetical protein